MFAKQMKADVQIVPATGTRRDGKMHLIAGHYRWKALTAAGIDTIKIIMRGPVTDKELYELSYKENVDRHPQSVIGNAFSWKSFLDIGVCRSETEISTSLGLPQPTVNKTI